MIVTRRLLAVATGVFIAVAASSTPSAQQPTPVYVFTTFAGKPFDTNRAIDDVGPYARFNLPLGVALEPGGSLVVADTQNNTIRRVSASGVVTTLAGTAGVFGGTDGVGPAASFGRPHHIAVDSSNGLIYVLDLSNRLRRVTPSGVVSTVATLPDQTGQSSLNGLAVDASGNIYISETGPEYCFPTLNGQRIFKVTPAGVVTTFAGQACQIGSTDAVGSAARFKQPAGLAFDSSGRLLVADNGNHTIRRIDPDGTVTTIAGIAGAVGTADGPAGTGRLNYPLAIAAAGGRVFLLEGQSVEERRLRELASSGLVTLAAISHVSSLTADASGAVTMTRGNITRREANGTITVVAGEEWDPSTKRGHVDATGTAALFNYPWGITPDATGGVFIADAMNQVIRHITSAGVVSTVAGFVGGVGTTDGASADARFNLPHGLGGDRNGTIVIADNANDRVRRRTSAGVVSTLPGTFVSPDDVAQDTGGNVYVSDNNAHAVYRITTGGQVELFAGQPGNAGNADGPVSTATLFQPRQIDVASDGTVYVIAGGLRRIRNGQVDTVATGVHGMALDTTGVLFYLTDNGVTRVATDGQTTSYPSVDARGHVYNVPVAFDMVVMSGERLLFVDQWNHNVIEASLQAAPAFTTQPSSQTVAAGSPATFTAGAGGTPSPTYRWQTSADAGSTWTDLTDSGVYSGATTPTLTVNPVSVQYPLRRFRAVATNTLGTATSNVATLTVPGLLVQPSSLRFRVQKGSDGVIRFHPFQELLATFVATSPGTITWSANQPWVRIAAASPGAPAVNVDILDSGNVLGSSTTASAVITASASGVTSVQVPLSLEIAQGDVATSAPIGQVDTPTQNATGVRGAIALSGWAIDDIGVSAVQIYRNCLTAEPQVNCQVGIIPGRSSDRVVAMGAAQLVPGARPDIEAAFPTYPGNRAGWGFLILSNMLPRTTGTYSPYGGQGPVTLYAVASDTSGNRTLLGRSWSNDATPTTVTLDNDTIARPFGTLDTPAQGERITTDTFNNFGWVLTPDNDTVSGNSDIEMANASGLTLFIDGMPITAIAYNQCRGTVGNPVPSGSFCNDDIANIFGNPTPQAALTARTSNPTVYRNLDAGRGAIGAATIDTTGLVNGLHTIAWSATDSIGRVEGIGSRYFSVLRTQTAPATAVAVPFGGRVFRPGETSGIVRARSGFDMSAPWIDVTPDTQSVHHLRIAELGRVELTLGGAATIETVPVGARFDAATGHFAWMPGPGFVGTYPLTFERGGSVVQVTVTIEPARELSTTESEIQMTPLEARGAVITGRASDSHAFTGHGIGAIHVWGWRVGAPDAPPVFLGTAEIAADGTYSLSLSQVERGVWDVTAYAWALRTARFEDARTVRVVIR